MAQIFRAVRFGFPDPIGIHENGLCLRQVQAFDPSKGKVLAVYFQKAQPRPENTFRRISTVLYFSETHYKYCCFPKNVFEV